MPRRSLSTLAAAALVACLLPSGAGAQTGRQQPPPAGPERPFRFPPHTTARLENGLTVFAIEDRRQPLVSATLMLPSAGSSSHPGTQGGLAAMTAALLRQGTTTRSAQQVAQAIDRVGGSLAAFTGPDATQATVTVVTSALDTGFELLADIVQRPAFAAAEIDRWRRQTLSSLQVAYTDPEYVRDVVGQRIAYGDHPYAYPGDGTPATVRVLTREDVMAFYRDRYTPSGAYIAVAGDIAPEAALAIVRKYFAAWKGPAATLPQAPAKQTGRRIVVIDKPDAVQTQFGAVGSAVPRNHPDRIALTVANQIFGGDFNSRLNLRLRAKEGLTYGARSTLESERLAGIWNVTSFTRTEETAKAMKVTFDVIEEFRSNPATEAEVKEATSFLAGVFAIQNETAGAVADRVLTSALHGLPEDYWQTYRDRIRKVTANDIAAAVRRHIAPGQLSIVAVGNASGFAKSLEPFGRVEIVPIARLDLLRPDLLPPADRPASPEAAARGLALVELAVEAIGGAALVTGIHDATSTGHVNLSTPAGEIKAEVEATVLHPDKAKVVMKLPVGEIVQAYDGTQGWMRMGAQPVADMPAQAHAELRRVAAMNAGVGLLREALAGRAEIAALEQKIIDGAPIDRVAWKKGDLDVIVGFDPATHRIVSVSFRAVTPQGPADAEIRLADYKPAANGLLVPMRATTIHNGQRVAELNVVEWRFNTGVSPDVFTRPK